VTRRQARCYDIKSNDRRSVCLALVRRDRRYCYDVKDADTRHFCLARAQSSSDAACGAP
jgi:hypothetical protein